MKMRTLILSLCGLFLFIAIGVAAPEPLPDKEVCEIAQPFDALLLCNEAPEALVMIAPISDGHYIAFVNESFTALLPFTINDYSLELLPDIVNNDNTELQPIYRQEERGNVESILARYPTNHEDRPAKKWVRCSPLIFS